MAGSDEVRGDGSGDGAVRRRRRRRWIAAGGLSLAALLASGAGTLYLHFDGIIKTFGLKGLSRNRPAPGAAGVNVLFLGSDSRAGANNRYGGGTGTVGHSDTAILLHVYGDHRHALSVSIPRDALVDIPPCLLPDGTWSPERHHAMFNSAFATGGSASGNPACAQNTVESLTGVRVDHTVVVDFSGFAAMTSAIGGVDVCVPDDIHAGDLDPGLGRRGPLLFPKGMQTLSGQRALDYVRLRHGIGDGSDIGRIRRQQAFLASLIRKVQSEGFNPATLLPLANAAVGSLTVDPGLGSADRLLAFALSLKDISPRDMRFVTAPWRYDGQRVDLVQPDADALWAALEADRAPDGLTTAGGRNNGADGPAPDSPSPGPGLPSADAGGTGGEARSAADDPCSNLTFG